MEKKQIAESLKNYLEKRGVKQQDLADILGISQPTVSNILTGRFPLSTDNAKILVREFPELNIAYLIAGEGELLLSSLTSTGKSISVPLIPLGARGGTLADYSEGATLKDCEMVVSPIRGADYAIQVTGDSMAPDYPSGSMLLIKKIDEAMFVEWGKVFVLDTANGAVVKIVRPTDDPAVVECSSIAPGFPPFKVRMDSVNGWYRVLMVMTLK